MGGSSVDDDWVMASPSRGPRTLVLVGGIGNGKSATGNSILQKKAFKSERNFSGVTHTCELNSTVLKDGQILNVIDTPGFFDCSAKAEFVVKEIAKCINMATDGIHAELLHQCESRWVLFDNRTRDQRKKDDQVQELLSLVNLVVAKSGGKPYTDELFVELKKGSTNFHDQTEVSNQEDKEQLSKRLTEVELKVQESTSRLEQQLEEEKSARLNAEKMVQTAQQKSNDEIRKLRKSLEKAERELRES